MIIGTGTDIIEISRIKKLMEESDFLNRFFTPAEIAYVKEKPPSAAACYAAKEAYSKALGTGIRDFSLKDIEVLHDELGKPYITAHNMAKLENCNTFLTLSHCREYAVAYVIIERKD